jgi:hypothetical protein
MLLALNTAVLRIAPAMQRRVLEDGAGFKKERWAAVVLDLPVLIAPPPLLQEDKGTLSDRLLLPTFTLPGSFEFVCVTCVLVHICTLPCDFTVCLRRAICASAH